MKTKILKTNIAAPTQPHINPFQGLNARKYKYWKELHERLGGNPGKDQIRKIVAYGMHTNLRVMSEAQMLAKELKEAAQKLSSPVNYQ